MKIDDGIPHPNVNAAVIGYNRRWGNGGRHLLWANALDIQHSTILSLGIEMMCRGFKPSGSHFVERWCLTESTDVTGDTLNHLTLCKLVKRMWNWPHAISILSIKAMIPRRCFQRRGFLVGLHNLISLHQEVTLHRHAWIVPSPQIQTKWIVLDCCNQLVFNV